MTDAEIERKLKAARRTNTAKTWRALAADFIKAGLHRDSEIVQNCYANADICALAELEKKSGRN